MENPLFKWSVRCLLINFYSSFFLLASVARFTASAAFNYQIAYIGYSLIPQDGYALISGFSSDAFTNSSDGTNNLSFYFAAVASNCRYAIYNFSMFTTGLPALSILNSAIDMSDSSYPSSYFQMNISTASSCTPANIVTVNDTVQANQLYFLTARKDTGSTQSQGYIAAISGNGALYYPSQSTDTASLKNWIAAVPAPSDYLVVASKGNLSLFSWNGTYSSLSTGSIQGPIGSGFHLLINSFTIGACASSSSCLVFENNLKFLMGFNPGTSTASITFAVVYSSLNFMTTALVDIIPILNVGYLVVNTTTVEFISISGYNGTLISPFNTFTGGTITKASFDSTANLLVLAITSPAAKKLQMWTYSPGAASATPIQNITVNWVVTALAVMRSSKMITVGYKDLLTNVSKISIFLNSSCSSLGLSNCVNCTATQCTLCAVGYSVSGTGCSLNPTSSCAFGSFSAVNQTSCLSTCGAGNFTYYDQANGGPTGVDNACKTCTTGCTCVGASNNCHQCTSATDIYLNVSSGTCTACTNSSNYFINGTYCDVCDATCLSCVTGYPTRCLTCRNQYFLSGTTCLPCTAPCTGCVNSSMTCTACASGLVDLNTFTCPSVCPSSMCISGGYCVACASIPSPSTNLSNQTGNLTTNQTDNQTNLPVQSSVFVVSTVFDNSSCKVILEFSDLVKFNPQKSHTISMNLYDTSAYSYLQLNSSLSSMSPENAFANLPKAVDSPTEITSYFKGSQFFISLQFGVDSVANHSLVVKFDSWCPLKSSSSDGCYMPYFAVVPNITFWYSKLDQGLIAVKEQVGTAIAAASWTFLLLSGTQGLLVIKFMQTLDFYIFIDVFLPTNVVLFFQMITRSAITVIPNLCEYFVDSDANEERDQFNNYGVSVNIFNNIGQFITLIGGFAVLRLIISLSSYVIRKISKGSLQFLVILLNMEFFYGLFESNNQDICLSLLIGFYALSRLHQRLLVHVLYLCFIIVLAATLGIIYLFVPLRIRRYLKLRQDGSHMDWMMKDPFKFWYDDKVHPPHMFQAFYGYFILLKDVLLSYSTYLLYYQPLALIICLIIFQGHFNYILFKHPPFTVPYKNNQQYIIQTIYLILNLLYLVLIMLPIENYSVRYYYIGFPIIGAVSVLILVAFYYSLKFSYINLKEGFKTCCKKKSVNKIGLAKAFEKMDTIKEGPSRSPTNLIPMRTIGSKKFTYENKISQIRITSKRGGDTSIRRNALASKSTLKQCITIGTSSKEVINDSIDLSPKHPLAGGILSSERISLPVEEVKSDPIQRIKFNRTTTKGEN